MNIAHFMSCYGPGREEYDKKNAACWLRLFLGDCFDQAAVAIAASAGKAYCLARRRAFDGECEDYNHRACSNYALKNRDQFHGLLPCY
jgi:hypothetical protein